MTQNKQNHIAIIRRSYRPDGGAERIIQRIIDGLSLHTPSEMTLITESWKEQGEQKFNIIPIAKHWCLRYKCIKDFCTSVQQVLQSYSFDIVQSHERIPGSQIYRAGDGVHAEWLEIRKQHLTYLKQFLLKVSPFHKTILQLERGVFTHSSLHKIVCIAEQGKQDILKHYPQVDKNKLIVIYNGIDLEKHTLMTATQRQQLRQKYRYKKNERIALFVGSGFERKGLNDLLNALVEVPDWKLIVIGKDKKQRKFEKTCRKLGINSRVQFFGIQQYMEEWYGIADLLIHPAWYEPFGNVILEAMASGLGVICSNKCGASELISTGKNGYIFEAGDSQQLAAYLKKCTNAKHLHDFGVSARKTAEKYPISRMVEKFIVVYQELLERK